MSQEAQAFVGAFSAGSDPLEVASRPGNLSVVFQPIIDLRPRSRLLHGVECLARGPLGTHPPSEIASRQVKMDNEWFVGARLEFERTPGVKTDAIRELLDKRKQSQPIGEWSCGSVFTNPPGDHAARLIESAGLKGCRIGDASVSVKHANFIINHGTARAADVEALIVHVQRTVAKIHGVELHTEVRIVGETA